MKSFIPIGAILIITFVIVFVAGIQQYKQGSIHYEGETILTTEQLYELMSLPRDEDDNIKDIDNVYEFYYKIKDDSVVLTYDFYSSLEFNYLKNKGIEKYLWDSPPFAYLIDGWEKDWIENKNELIKNCSIMVIVILLLWYFIYWIEHNQTKALKYANKFGGFIFKKLDDRLPIVDKYNVINTFDKFDINNINGIVCTRSWKPDGQGNLKSLVKATKWESNELYSDKNPDKDNRHGIYAYRVGALLEQKGDIIGIVEMDGKYQYHPDGVVRTEHCKILGLFVRSSRQRLGKLLSNKYNVPVYFCNTAVEGYLDWLYSKFGMLSIQHNSKILEGVK